MVSTMRNITLDTNTVLYGRLVPLLQVCCAFDAFFPLADKLTAHTSWDITPDANAVYARANFTITQRKCFTDLVIYYFPAYGLAVYLNGVEAFRFNLPQGPLTSSTTVSMMVYSTVLNSQVQCSTV